MLPSMSNLKYLIMSEILIGKITLEINRKKTNVLFIKFFDIF